MSDDRRGRGPAWTAADDQAAAAQAAAGRRMRDGFLIGSAAESVASGRPPAPVEQAEGMPYGPVADVVNRVVRRLGAGELTGCSHVANALAPGLSRGPAVEAVFWLSWHPDEVNCPACAVLLPAATGDEDYRCDGCGKLVPPGQMKIRSDVTRANPATSVGGGRLGPALVCQFGLCPACNDASGYHPAPRQTPGR
jgi:hypothetical protein